MSEQIEVGLLGCLLEKPEVFETLTVKPSYFNSQANRVIFVELQKAFQKAKPFDTIMLITHLIALQRLADVGGVEYINQVSQSACSPSNAVSYASILKDKSIRREIRLVCADVANEVETAKPSDEIVRSLVDRVESVVSDDDTSDPLDTGSVLAMHVQIMERRHSGTERFTSTGLTDLDSKLGGGFADTDLVIVAGRPAMGKTAFSLNIARKVAQCAPVLFISMEMSATQLADRNIAAYGSVPLGWVKNPDDNDLYWTAYSRSVNGL